MKRLIYTIAIIAGIGIVVYLGFIFRYKGGTTPTETGDTTGSGSLPGDEGAQPIQPSPSSTGEGGDIGDLSEKAQFGKVSDDPVLGYFAAADGSVMFVQTDGKVVRVKDKKAEILSASPVPNLTQAKFSYDGKKVLVMIAGTNGNQASMFDTGTRVWELFSGVPTNAVWAPRVNQIAYIIEEGGNSKLITSGVEGTKKNPQTLITLPGYDLVPDWISPDEIAVSEIATARVPSSLWIFNIKRRTFTLTIARENGLTAEWGVATTTPGIVFASPLGARKKGGALTLRNKQGVTQKSLRILTLPSKCSFMSNATSSASSSLSVTTNVVVCGIPRDPNLLLNAELPDDYQKGTLYTSDDIYHMDLETGDLQLMRSEQNENLDIAQPTIAADKFFFVNRFDNLLYFLTI